MSTPEARLRAAVLKRIREDYPPSKRQVLVFGRPANASTGPGHPDLFGIALGHFLALEIKLPKVHPAPLQIERIADLRRAGAYAWVVRSTLAASKAVYQAKLGGRVPTPEEPIDFDDWFKSIASAPSEEPKPESPFAATATKGDDIPLSDDPNDFPPTTDEPAAEMLAEMLTEIVPDERLTPRPVEPSPEALVEMPEVNNAGARRGRYADKVRPIAHVTDDDVMAAIVVLSDLIKAVGDRTTEVYEGVNRVETLLRSRHNLLADLAQEVIGMRSVLNNILAEVGMDDQVQQPIVEEPTPFDDITLSNGEAEQAEPPKRGRGRPRKS